MAKRMKKYAVATRSIKLPGGRIYAVEATTQKAAINKVRRKWGPLSVLYVEER